MRAVFRQGKFSICDPLWGDRNASFDFGYQGEAANFVDINDKPLCRLVPCQRGWPNRQLVLGLSKGGMPPVGHGETTFGAVCGNIYAHVVLRAFAA